MLIKEFCDPIEDLVWYPHLRHPVDQRGAVYGVESLQNAQDKDWDERIR